ncbi:hypothetical protein EV363DRAFT_1167907 [Boletus edulis]|nr:hypothetical protein EV363DRAFT_1167907 [Boletus edulis]
MTSKTIGRTGVLGFILTYAKGQMLLSRFSGGHFKLSWYLFRKRFSHQGCLVVESVSKPFHTVMLGGPPDVFSSTLVWFKPQQMRLLDFFPLGRTKYIQHSFSTWEGWTFQP